MHADDRRAGRGNEGCENEAVCGMKILSTVPFDRAFVDEPVGKRKVGERDYQRSGKYPIVDQGQQMIAGYTDSTELARDGVPRIVFGDHTRVVKFVNFPFVVGADGVRLFQAASGYLPEFLFFYLRAAKLPQDTYGRHSKYLSALEVPVVSGSDKLSSASRSRHAWP